MLDIPEGALGLVLFAHGSGSSRHSPRNNSEYRSAAAAAILGDEAKAVVSRGGRPELNRPSNSP